MKVLFLCPGGPACRSLIAKEVLHLLDEELEIYATGLTEELCPSDELIEVLKQDGFRIEPEKQSQMSELELIHFDFLITLCEGTREEFNKLNLKYNKKLHLGFVDPEKDNVHISDKKMRYKELLDEIKTELSYFYHHILVQTKKD